MNNSIKLYGKMLSFSTLAFTSDDITQIEAELKAKFASNSNSGIPVVIDAEKPLDITTLFNILRKNGLQPIGVLDGVLAEPAKEKHIAIFPKGKALEKIEPKKEQGNTVIFDRVLRSGQSLDNAEGDIVLTQGSNNGSEAIATGSLHVYGKAKGRLVAGATGEPNAYIFCQHLEPTLISIAGVFCLRDNIPEEMIGKAVYIKCEKDAGLVFTRMNPDIK